MNDHRPPLWGYDALAITLTSAFVVALLLLASEVASICVQVTVPPLQRLLRWAGRDPPQWSEDLLELADVLEAIVERVLYELWDRFDGPLYSALRWLWRRLQLDWVVEVALLVADICSVLPREAWRWLLQEGRDEGPTDSDGQPPDRLLAGRGLDDGGGTGDRRQPHS